jgi:hypothetical protein
MKKEKIKHQTLKNLLKYEEKTGNFFWINNGAGRNFKKPAGFVDFKGYRLIKLLGNTYMLHRLAWFYITGEWPKEQIDHINGNKSDNRFENLREASNSQNQFNLGLRSTNKSGYKGVSWSKVKGKWHAVAYLNYKSYSLGFYDDIIEAAQAYKDFAKIVHGEFYKESNHVGAC